MYPTPDQYPPSQQGGTPYPPQGNYPPQAPYPPQYPYVNQQPPYPPQYPYANQQPPYPPQYPYMNQQANVVPKNAQARRAMIYGFISLVLGVVTLFTLVGFAGIITGTFSIVYGIMGLNFAKRFPNNPGTGQAVTGIVLGGLAWLLVIASFLLRSTNMP